MPKKEGQASDVEERIDRLRTRVTVKNVAPSNAAGIHDAHAFSSLGLDNSLTVQSFKDKFRIQIMKMSEDAMMFDLIGIDAPLANAFRRILLAEVPTMAIEKVVFYQNTSLLADEVLAHRLGLIPIKADARRFQFLKENHGEANENNTTVFVLDVKCSSNPNATKHSPVADKYINSEVLTSALEWVPQGRQETTHKDGISPVDADIVIAKLRPGQEIVAELHVQKGIGQTHAKFSPVCTASYRLLPDVSIPKPVTGKDAVALVAKCPMQVFDIEDLGGTKTAVVREGGARNCSMCRECIREEGWEDRVSLSRVRDHFIFSVESTGALPPADLFREAVKVLSTKAQALI